MGRVTSPRLTGEALAAARHGALMDCPVVDSLGVTLREGQWVRWFSQAAQETRVGRVRDVRPGWRLDWSRGGGGRETANRDLAADRLGATWRNANGTRVEGSCPPAETTIVTEAAEIGRLELDDVDLAILATEVQIATLQAKLRALGTERSARQREWFGAGPAEVAG